MPLEVARAQPMKEGEETGVPGENPWQRASENATYYILPEDTSPERDSNTHNNIGGRLGKQAC